MSNGLQMPNGGGHSQIAFIDPVFQNILKNKPAFYIWRVEVLLAIICHFICSIKIKLNKKKKKTLMNKFL
jgi:hypothetical protein